MDEEGVGEDARGRGKWSAPKPPKILLCIFTIGFFQNLGSQDFRGVQ